MRQDQTGELLDHLERVQKERNNIMAIQFDEAKEIGKEWGNKHCSHPRIEKEYYLGTNTGDWVCAACGMSGPREMFEEIKSKKREKSDSK